MPDGGSTGSTGTASESNGQRDLGDFAWLAPDDLLSADDDSDVYTLVVRKNMWRFGGPPTTASYITDGTLSDGLGDGLFGRLEPFLKHRPK